MRLQVVYGIAGYAFAPFLVYYLKTALDYSQSYILMLMALQFVGILGESMIIKEWFDQYQCLPWLLCLSAGIASSYVEGIYEDQR